MSIDYGAASSFAAVAYFVLSNPGTVTGDVAYNTGTPPTFNPAIGGGTVKPLTPAITDAVDDAINQINGLTGTTINNNLNIEWNTNTLTITGTNVYDCTGDLTNNAPFTIIGGPTDYAVFRADTITFANSIFASYPQNITFIALSSGVVVPNISLTNGTYSGTYIASGSPCKIYLYQSKIFGHAISKGELDMDLSTIYLPGFLPPITLGLAENYAILGSKYLYIQNNNPTPLIVKGFMGSNFLSYPTNPSVDSNGIELYGTMPNAPIVNGAAALQAIDDVNNAITQYLQLPVVYNDVGGDLNTIIIGPGLYNINGNLTTNAPITLTGTGIYVFNVTSDITITNNITLTGILPQSFIFIASGFILIDNSTISGIYISTDSFANIQNTTLTGRLISTDTIINGYASMNTSNITAPQFA